jgi:hypothetical protein
MALRLSVGMRDKMLGGGGGTAGIRAILDGGFLDIFTGSQPVTADAVETGTKLVRVSSTSGTGVSDGLRFGTASGGTIPLTVPVWSGKVQAAGVAGWFRFYGTGATSGVSGSSGTNGTSVRMDGACGISGADLDLTHTNLALDSTLTITAADIVQPAE